MSPSLDYEYIPPNEKAPAPYSSDLPSIYPPDTPAGLRGEAVRSALRSSRCIAWDLSDTPLAVGWIRVQGAGTGDFLQNKFSQSFSFTGESSLPSFTKTCLLDAKGKVVDQISVACVEKETAYLLTSPGHSGPSLFERLDPLIFPMDQVKLTDFTQQSRIVTIASTRQEHVRAALEKFVNPLLNDSDLAFPASIQACSALSLDDEKEATLFILPHVILPECACEGYTLVFTNDTNSVGAKVWEALVGESNPDGPIQIGALEFEALRIEAGWPAYGKELTASMKKDEVVSPPPGPLELHWHSLVDLEKGCYLGQEGVASVVKNPRGPPRLLYSVVFEDDGNIYNHQSEGDKSKVENLTTLPKEGQELFVLGSNEQISVGRLTSVAEPGGTGESTIVGLALVRRADSILKQMKDMELEVGPSTFRETAPVESDGSGIIAPPPLDPLDGLEVIVGGTFTVGSLKMIPSRRYVNGQKLFEDIEIYESEEAGTVMGYLPRDGPAPAEPAVAEEELEEDLEKAIEEAAKAEAKAEAAAAEAKRKAEKMDMLKKRAEEAMARRKKKNAGQ